MNVKKLILAIVVAYIVLMGTNYWIHGVWLMPSYQQYPDTWRPLAQMRHKIWIMWAGQLLFAILFAYIYTRGVESKPRLGQGFRYGILMALFTAIPYSLSEYVVYPVPHMIALKWIIAGSIQMIILGLIVGGIYQVSRS